MSASGKAIFVSYASQDTEAARCICDALRGAGLEVWFDQSELRGGDAWDASIRKQIKVCTLFVPIISANTQAREEGYFRREWNLAAHRTLDMADDKAFLLPVVIDATLDADARVPEKFREVQWTHLPTGAPLVAFTEHVQRLLAGGAAAPMAAAVLPFLSRSHDPGDGELTSVATDSQTRSRRAVEVVPKIALLVIVVIALAIASLFVGRKLIESNGSKSPQATTEAVAPPATPKQVVAPPTSMQGIAGDSRTLPASAPEAAPRVRAARGAEGAPTPALTQPVTAPAAATATASAKVKSRTDPSPAASVPADATSDRSGPRCSRIMEKATLGEALSTEEKRELATSCR